MWGWGKLPRLGTDARGGAQKYAQAFFTCRIVEKLMANKLVFGLQFSAALRPNLLYLT